MSESQAEFEKVFTVIEYVDGPVKGIADFRGQPHFYERVFDHKHDRYSDDLFRLTPVPPDVLEFALEDWGIFRRWELAYHYGKTSLESRPALPPDRLRHEELRPLLESKLKTSDDNHLLRQGRFEVVEVASLPKGVMRPMKVTWMEPPN